MEENRLLKVFQILFEKRSRVRGNLRLKVLLKSQYEALHRRYLSEIQDCFNSSQQGTVSLNSVHNSNTANDVPKSDKSSKENVVSKKRVIHVHHVKNKRFKPSSLACDNITESSNAECLSESQNRYLQSQKTHSTNQTSNKSGKENDVVWSKRGARGILQTLWEKSMFQSLGNWLKECGVDVDNDECYFSPYLDHPINVEHHPRIKELLLMWQVYLRSRSSNLSPFQMRKNNKILAILKKLVAQYEAYQASNGENEILNLQLRKNRCKLKKLARKVFDFTCQ